MRVEKFICNTTWQLNQRLTEQLEEIQKIALQFKTEESSLLQSWQKRWPVRWLTRQTKISKSSNQGIYGIYFYGDPGIGKSSAFATIFYLMTHQCNNVQEHYKKLFPFFSEHSNFIYIEGGQLTKYKEPQLQMFANRLVSRKFVVVIDDIHFLKTQAIIQQHFLKVLQKSCEKLIFLSSQGPARDPFKNTFGKNVLVELPQTEAVLQISDIIKKSKGGQDLSPSMSEYYAYRLWFYMGGNFRNFKKIMKMPHEYWFTYLGEFLQYLENASRIAIADSAPQNTQDRKEEKKTQNKESKRTHFENVLKYMEKEKHDLYSIMNLKFGTLKLRPIFQKKNQDQSIADFMTQNILVFRNFNGLPNKDQRIDGIDGKHQLAHQNDLKFKPTDITKPVIGFHSRRVQYAFGQYFLEIFINYWKSEKERAKFEHYLQRVEYQHILDFELYRLHKRIREEEILQLLSKEKKLNIKLDQQEQERLKLYLEAKTKIEPVMRLVAAENELAMIYYEAYQNVTSPQKFQGGDHFVLKRIFDCLRKGPNFFYKAFKNEIEVGLDNSDDLKQKVRLLRKNIEVFQENVQVLKLRQEYLIEDLKGYREDLQALVERVMLFGKRADQTLDLVFNKNSSLQEKLNYLDDKLPSWLQQNGAYQQYWKLCEVRNIRDGLQTQLEECTKKISEKQKVGKDADGKSGGYEEKEGENKVA